MKEEEAGKAGEGRDEQSKRPSTLASSIYAFESRDDQEMAGVGGCVTGPGELTGKQQRRRQWKTQASCQTVGATCTREILEEFCSKGLHEQSRATSEICLEQIGCARVP